MTRDLTVGSVWKHIWVLAIPAFLSVAIQQIYSLVDTVIVGRVLGPEPLAGVGSTNGIYFTIVYFCIGCCAGCGIPLAQEFGAKNYERMRRFFGNSIWLCISVCLVLMIAMSLLCGSFLHWMKTPTEVYDHAYNYILFIFLGLPFTFFYNLLASVVRGLGDSRTPLIALIVSSVVNIGLDYTLMAVIELGVTGAAIATVLAQGVAGAFCLIVLIKKFDIIKLKKKDLAFDGQCIKKISLVSLPMGLQCSITGIGTMILQSAFNSFGPAAVAGVAVGAKTMHLLNSPFDGLGQIMAPFAGQNLGAKQLKRIKEGLFKSILAGWIWSILVIPIAFFGNRFFVNLFLTEPTEEIIGYASTLLMWGLCASSLLCLVNIVRFTIQGMGYSAFAMITGVMETIARIIAGLVFAPAFGFNGAACGHAFAWLLADIFLVPAFFWCYKKELKKLEAA